MFNYKSTYKELPSRFYTETKINNFTDLKPILINTDLIKSLGSNLDTKNLSKLIDNILNSPDNSNIAQVYSGHQFGHFSARLGDGRAMLLCEVEDSSNNLFDIHLKGSGRTVYSRGGDGYSAIGPVIREHILCEAMNSLNVPTTRAVASFTTGEKVLRDGNVSGGMFARLASSHIRIGTFEYFASQGDIEGLQTLVDYSIKRHYSNLITSNDLYIDFILAVAKKQAKMIAKWMSLGFIHGVMNTDNMLISGETIDYGPCAFMDNYESNKVFSSIDRNSRYSYENQIHIGIWNLYRFASTLIPLIDSNEDIAIEKLKIALKDIDLLYKTEHIIRMNEKLGLESEENMAIAEKLLIQMQKENLDFTNTFKELTHSPDRFINFDFYDEWIKLNPNFEIMKKVNPYFIPRNHQVEMAIQDAESGSFDKFKSLVESYKKPFEPNEELEKSPTLDQEVTQTFCGT